MTMYDDFSTNYDRFVDWESRLAVELPFLERKLQAVGAHRVLDTACGTGMHAIALAERGYEVVGSDASEGMIEQAQDNAAQAGVDVRFAVAGFGHLAESLISASSPATIGGGFDAILCLGNSLPHVLTPEDLTVTVEDFAACLRPGGLLLIQNRNFEPVLARRDRWMPPQTYKQGNREWLFLRFYDFEPDGLLTFSVVQLQREKGEPWSQQVTSTRLRPLTVEELRQALVGAGFEAVTLYGDLQGSTFETAVSPNLVVEAHLGG